MPETETYDIVIVGAGPCGLLLAICLARFGFRIKIIDKRSTPTLTGRADGIQPRSLDLLRDLGLKRAIMAHEPAKVYEVAFWDPLPHNQGIHRTNSSKACPEDIGARYPFTTLLHQGLIEGVFINDLRDKGVVVERPWTIVDFNNDRNSKDHPIEVLLKHAETNQQEMVRTKYLFSGEGAKSIIRDRLGIQLQHKDEVTNVWGVMDGVVKTNFPDIKLKCTIHSDQGSIMIIPRENNLVRLYIQLATSSDADFDPHKQATPEEVQKAAKAILLPYRIDWEHVEWCSTYPIGQGIAGRYTIDNRVFLGGDCCHTHSPKAGQGMNTAFHDSLNLAWKLFLVEGGFAKESSLDTYESERQRIAKQLLDFDARYAALFSQRIPSDKEEGPGLDDGPTRGRPNEFTKVFREGQDFTSGYGIAYQSNIFNWSEGHSARSRLFVPHNNKLIPGRIMPHVSVTRVADANVVKLDHEVPLDGSFRIFVFAGRPEVSKQALVDFASNLEKPRSFLSAHSHEDAASISHHERHHPHSRFYTFCLIFAIARSQIEILALPSLLARYSDHVYADDLWDTKTQGFQDAAHVRMGFSGEKASVLVVRPDGHVGCIVSLVEGNGTVDALNEYFDAFTTKSLGSTRTWSRL